MTFVVKYLLDAEGLKQASVYFFLGGALKEFFFCSFVIVGLARNDLTRVFAIVWDKSGDIFLAVYNIVDNVRTVMHMQDLSVTNH